MPLYKADEQHQIEEMHIRDEEDESEKERKRVVSMSDI